jgi:hypothetical protein
VAERGIARPAGFGPRLHGEGLGLQLPRGPAILTARPVTQPLRRAAARVLVPLGYLALAIAASWPLARDFATYTIGDVHYDERHAIWTLWYTAQAIAGRVSWPETTHLLWPHGISLLVEGIGPLNGMFALPFWPWGAAAAFNGAALAGLALSGWSLYALAREIGLPRGPAFVAGALYLLWPIHLVALSGHLEKLFTGLLPLTLLAGLRAFDPQRHRGWLIAPGVGLLGALLQNGNQFTFAALGLGLLAVQTWLAPLERTARLRRALQAAASSVVICGPLLLAIVLVMRDPTLEVALGEHAFYYSPDALSLVLPAPHQWWAGWLYPNRAHLPDYVWASTLPGLNPTPTWYGTGLETVVGIPVVAIVLGACGWREPAGRAWIVFGLAFAALCLGPRLRIGGEVTPIRLPHVVAKRVPGLNVMRTPGRYMLVGSVGFALGAGAGLAALIRRRPARATAVVAIAAALAALECWPRPWAQTALPQVPDFYRRLATQRAGGAVLDLPHGHYSFGVYASAYMYYQTVHQHSIAWSNLSRNHRQFPVAGLEGLWNPQVAAGPALRTRLRALGYRYVVVHRHAEIFLGGWVEHGRLGRPVGPPTPPESERLIREAFGGEAPVHVDDLVTVWAP